MKKAMRQKVRQELDSCEFRVRWSPEDKAYVGTCSEGLSLSWLAKTPEKALRGIRKIVADIIIDEFEDSLSASRRRSQRAQRITAHIKQSASRALLALRSRKY